MSVNQAGKYIQTNYKTPNRLEWVELNTKKFSLTLMVESGSLRMEASSDLRGLETYDSFWYSLSRRASCSLLNAVL